MNKITLFYGSIFMAFGLGLRLSIFISESAWFYFTAGLLLIVFDILNTKKKKFDRKWRKK